MSASEESAVAPPVSADTSLGAHPLQTAHRWFERVRRKLTLEEETFFLLLAVIIGLFAGLAVVCFRISIDWIRFQVFGSALYPGPLRVILVPTLGGLLLAFLVIRLFPLVRGSGVNQTKSAVYVYDGYIPFHTVIGKFLMCALAIGTGQSLGPEDPSLQMGAGMASALGQRLRLSREKIRLIAPVGAAAGLAAAFNAPIAAVIFVIEEVIGTWSAGILGAVVLAAVSSVVVERLFLGAEPLFRVPAYTLVHPAELLSYAVLGVIGGVSSLVFLKLVIYGRTKAKALPRWSEYAQPAIAGLMIGIIAIWLPQVMGAGYEFMDQAMHGQYVWYLLLLLGFAKILSTSLSFSSGAPGGMFAPTMFVGTMIGGAVGSLQHAFFPATAGPVGSYALVGLGTLFAGFLRAPMTSVFMVLEVSGNYSIILPVLISNTVAYLISRRFQPTPIFDILTRQEGLDLPSMEELREETTLRVEDAMRTPTIPILQSSDTVQEALLRVGDSEEEFVLVSYPTGRWGCVKKQTLHQFVQDGKQETALRVLLGETRLPRLHPDQPLDLALRFMRDWPYLPVVHRANARRLEGVLALPDILNAYVRESSNE